MPFSRLFRLLAPALLLGLAACRPSPERVVFEIPPGFEGPFIVRRDPHARDAWRDLGQTLVLRIQGPVTAVRDEPKTQGKWLSYEARLKDGTVVPSVDIADTKTHPGLGLFMYWTTTEGETVYYLGRGADALAHYERLNNPP